MTTYTFRAIRVNETANTVQSTTIVMRVSDDYRMTYQYIGDVEPDDITLIDLNAAQGTDYQVVVSGERAGPGWMPMVGEVTLNGKQSQIMVLDHPGNEGVWTMIQLGGEPLPPITTPAELESFFDAATNITGLMPDALGPNTQLDVRNFTSFVSANENDVLIADGRFDEWDGRTIATGKGHDRVEGISADDVFELGSGNDTGIGGSGNDTMRGGGGMDRLSGESGRDWLAGEAGADSIKGGTGSDTLMGGAGLDTLDGGNDHDSLIGGGGADVLRGNLGTDTMTGGAGDDLFHFRGGYGSDRITDFADGADALYIGDFGPDDTKAEVLALARNIDGGVRFDFNADDVLIVMGVTKAQIADQLFVG